jgi:hypothetical protein
MQMKTISLPELGMIAGTRVALGAGIALLFGGRLSTEQRRAVGWTLLGIGAVSTLPLAAEVLLRNEKGTSSVRRDPAEPERETAQSAEGRW